MSYANLIEEWKRPYIHSHGANFIDIAEQLRVEKRIKASNDLIDKKIQDLEKVKEALRKEAEKFLGDKSVKDIMTHVNDPYQYFIEIALDIIDSKGFYDKVMDKIKKDFSLQDIENILSKIGLDKAIAEDVLNNLNGGKSLSKLIKAIETTIKTNNGNNNKINIAMNDELISVDPSSNFYKTIRDATYEITNLTKESFYIAIIDEFEEEFNKLCRKEDYVFAKDFSRNKEDYLKKVKERLKKEVEKAASPSRSEKPLFGFGGEGLFGAVNIGKKDGLEIEIVGMQKTSEMRKSLGFDENNTKFLSLKKQSTESYVDIRLTHNGTTVNVQSKNFQSVLDYYLNGNTYIPQRINVSGNKKYTDFIDTIKKIGDTKNGNSLNIEQNEIDWMSYVIANDMWFQAKGDIKNKKGKGALKLNHGKDVEAILSNVLINYAGIMTSQVGDNLEISTELSNIFYLIDNRALLPTYEIVQGLINALEGEKISNVGQVLYISNNGGFGGTAKEFLNAKSKVASGLNMNKRYEDGALLEEGKKQGKTIIDRTEVHSNVEINLDALFNSSYIFTEKELGKYVFR